MANRVAKSGGTSRGILVAIFSQSPYSGPYTSGIWIEGDVAFDSNVLSDLTGGSVNQNVIAFLELFASNWGASSNQATLGLAWNASTLKFYANSKSVGSGTPVFLIPTGGVVSLTAYHFKVHVVPGTPWTMEAWINGVQFPTISTNGTYDSSNELYLENFGSNNNHYIYFDNITVGTTNGGSDILSDNFESGTISTTTWNGTNQGTANTADPGINFPGIDSATISGVTTVSSAAEQAAISDAATITTITVPFVTEGNYLFSYPTSDVAAGNWTPSTGVSLWACVDETIPSDADYIQATVT